MSHQRDKFIAEVVKDLDAEGQMHAGAELYVEIDADASEEAFSTARARLQKTNTFKSSRVRISMMVLLFISFAMMLGVRNTSGLVAYKDLRFMEKLEQKYFDVSSLIKNEVNLTPEEKRIINYDGSHFLNHWNGKQSDFSKFIYDLIYRYRYKKYPTVELALAKQHDPDNSLYFLVQLKEISTLKQAFDKSQFRETFRKHEQLKFAILLNRQGADVASRFKCFLALISRLSYDVERADELTANYERLSREGNIEEIKWWLPRHQQHWQQRLDAIYTIYQLRFFREGMIEVLDAMIESAEQAGLPETVAKLSILQELLEKDKADNLTAKNESSRKGSSIFLFLHDVNESPYFNHELSAPLRYAEHAIKGRFYSSFAWCILGLVLLTMWIYRFVRKIAITPLGYKISSCLKLRDWCLILFSGVLFPIGFYWVLTRYTSLSAREWIFVLKQGEEFSEYAWINDLLFDLAAIGQFVAMLLTMLCTSIWAVRWRLNKAFPMLVRSTSGLLYLTTVFAITAMILAGFVESKNGNALWLMCGLLGIVINYFIFIAVRFAVRRPSIEKYAVNRTLTPVIAVMVLMITVLAACFYEEEKYYVASSSIMNFDPKTGTTIYETEVLKLEKEALQKKLDMLGPILISDTDGE